MYIFNTLILKVACVTFVESGGLDFLARWVAVNYEETLKKLSSAYGITPGYTSSSGEYIEASAETLIKLLHAMGVDVSSETDTTGLQSLLADHELEEATRLLPRCLVSPEGVEVSFVVHVPHGAPAHVHIECEDGTRREVYQDENFSPPVTKDGIEWGEASFHTPGDLPTGYHQLFLESDNISVSTELIITPTRLSTSDALLEKPTFGVMAQLYSVRSSDSWGIGDFHDLGQLSSTLAKEIGADFLQINPLHAAEPFPPVEDSPYLPSSRRYINPLYLRIEDVPEYNNLNPQTMSEIRDIARTHQEKNSSAEAIVRNPIYADKLNVLRELFQWGLSPSRQEIFDEFVRGEGPGLVEFARWCANQEHETQEASDHALNDDSEFNDTTRFYMWLQFLCDEQLEAAQKTAKDAGMSIGIVTDLAVGVHPGGADAATLDAWLAPEASVGAPPDPYNQQGQDWSQPPWNPIELAEAGYKPWRDMMSTVMRHSGGVRVDHILGMFRLFWMPRMEPPSTGTYVTYDFEAMLGILILEAERAGAVLIGEDLGTFEPWVQDVLASRGVLGTNVVWFESENDAPKPPESYRRLAMTSVGTHDLPPTAGYLEGTHISLRDELGVLTTDAEEEYADDLHWQAQILSAIQARGFFEATSAENIDFHSASRDERGDISDLLVGLHRWAAATPSALLCTNLVDLVGDKRIQNQPGTNATQYPNWRIPLTDDNGEIVLLENLADNELFKRIGEASKR